MITEDDIKVGNKYIYMNDKDHILEYLGKDPYTGAHTWMCLNEKSKNWWLLDGTTKGLRVAGQTMTCGIYAMLNNLTLYEEMQDNNTKRSDGFIWQKNMDTGLWEIEGYY